MIILLVRFLVTLFNDVFKVEWLYYLLVVGLIIFLISLCDELNDRFKRIPFGPMRIPLLGNHLQLRIRGGNYPYRAITKMSKGYDGFMKVFFGLTGYISVNGNAKINEVMTNEEWFGERDETWRLDRLDLERRSNGSLMIWVSRRNIAIRCLKEHIFSRKEGLNSLIRKNVKDLQEAIDSQEKVDKLATRELNSDVFLPYILSTVWAVLTGDQEMNVTDRRIQTLHRCLKEWEAKTIGITGKPEYVPFLARWFPGWLGLNKLKETSDDFRKFLKALIKEQYNKAETGKSGSESFVQACIREFKNLRKESMGGAQMNDSSSIALLFEFLCPGPLILSSHVGFAVYLASRDQKAQDRILAEIHAAFGPEEVPTIEKMDKMPYTTAFILETTRIASVVPWEKRKLLKTVRQGETRFPEDLPLLINYHSANFDPKVWQNPEVFDPERFLSPTGSIINENKLVSLTAEKHLCAGQPLLRMMLFSFFTGTLQKFKFEINPHFVEKGPDFGIINRPQPFKVTVKPRLTAS